MRPPRNTIARMTMMAIPPKISAYSAIVCPSLRSRTLKTAFCAYTRSDIAPRVPQSRRDQTRGARARVPPVPPHALACQPGEGAGKGPVQGPLLIRDAHSCQGLHTPFRVLRWGEGGGLVAGCDPRCVHVSREGGHDEHRYDRGERGAERDCAGDHRRLP